MYAASTIYKNYIASSRVRVPKSKIVVDGVTYTGQQYLKTYPEISHSNSKMIGGFPAKSCEFEIYNLDGNIDLNGKEISVYRGLEIDGTVTWIPMGMFTAKNEDITNNKTARSISFKGTDRAVAFDCAYGGSLNYPTTLGDFVQEICNRHGIPLETTTFPMSTFELTEAPNMDASITDRELISRAAELGGCIAQISRSGGLQISKPVTTGMQLGKSRYKTVSKEPTFGTINSIVFGHSGYDDDIVYPATAPDNLCQWRIDDNPFIDKTRETSIETVAAQIFGMSIIPFQLTDCIDDYIFDLNDTVSVQDKDGTYFTATILQIETTARIRSKISAETQTVKKTDYKMAGSIMQTLKKVQLQVDHQNLSIQTLVQNISNMSSSISTLTQTANSLSATVTKIEGEYVTQSTIEQLNNEINIRFNSIGTPSELSNATTTINAQGIKVEDGSFTAESEGFKTDLSAGYIKLYQALNQSSGTNFNYLSILDTVLYTSAVAADWYVTFAAPEPSVSGVTSKGFRFGKSDTNASAVMPVVNELEYNWDTDYVLIEKEALRVRKQIVVNEAGYGTGTDPSGTARYMGLAIPGTLGGMTRRASFGVSMVPGTSSPGATILLEQLSDGEYSVNAELGILSAAVGTSATIRMRSGTTNLPALTFNASALYYNGKAVTTSSTERIKKDIEAVNFSASDKIRDAQIYSYRLKDEHTYDGQPDSIARYGLVVERECPEEVMDVGGDSINLYSMCSLGWKAIQEIISRLDRLEAKA